MLMFTLAISRLTTSNLPWFMALTFQVPMQYCPLQHQILLLSPVPFTTGCCFCFGSIPSFFLDLFLHWSPVAYWAPYRPGEFLFQYPIILPFHTVHGVLKARILKLFAIPFSSGPHSVRPLHHDLPVLGCPTGMAWFYWVRQGRGPSVIRLTSFLWVWFQCVCPLMPSCNTYHLTWVFLTLGMGYLFTAAPAKLSHCSLPWTKGISSPCPSWPSTWDSSSRQINHVWWNNTYTKMNFLYFPTFQCIEKLEVIFSPWTGKAVTFSIWKTESKGCFPEKGVKRCQSE